MNVLYVHDSQSTFRDIIVYANKKLKCQTLGSLSIPVLKLLERNASIINLPACFQGATPVLK
jgi:hypothetical protein